MNKEIELKPCREAFEAWYDAAWWHNHTGSEPYFYPTKEDAWIIWQAAQAQLQAEVDRLRGAVKGMFDLSEIAYETARDNYIPKGDMQRYIKRNQHELQEIAKAALQHNEGI
jgi:hypothetical protein